MAEPFRSNGVGGNVKIEPRKEWAMPQLKSARAVKSCQKIDQQLASSAKD
jgi:hypothetical protein